jgi:type I restriction enzyme M protein
VHYDKWAATITTRVARELTSLALTLVSRIQQLGERYDETLADLQAELADLDRKTATHLADMGIK